MVFQVKTWNIKVFFLSFCFMSLILTLIRIQNKLQPNLTKIIKYVSWLENVPRVSNRYIYLQSEEHLNHNRSLFFVEGLFLKELSPRMLCSIESAAVTHPETFVDVMLTVQKMRMTSIIKELMKNYKNLRFLYLNAEKLYFEAGMKDWLYQETWKRSPWPKAAFSDPLRFLLLWKYGGVYLDLDVIALKNLMAEENFAGVESDEFVNCATIGFRKRHPFLQDCIDEMAKHFNDRLWATNGPHLITKILKTRCGMEMPSGNLKKCPDIKIYHREVLYPIPWWTYEAIFQNNKTLGEKLIQDPEILALHLWNRNTIRYDFLLNNTSPYAIIAKKLCPTVFYKSKYKL